MEPVDFSSVPPDGRSCPPIGIRRPGIRLRLHTRGGVTAGTPGAAAAAGGPAAEARPGTAGPGSVAGGAGSATASGPGPSLAQLGDPFVAQFTGAAPFRSYSAAVESNSRDLVPFVTVLLQPNEYPGLRATTAQPSATNLQTEKVWREAIASLLATRSEGAARIERNLMAAGPGAAGPAAPGPAAAYPAPASADGLPRTGPLAFCIRTGEYIEPVCPACLGRLTLCRDETLLRTSGLPAYATTLSRYLYCETCTAGPGRAPTVYTYSLRDGDGAAPGVRVRRRGELYRDLAPAVHGQSRPPEAEHFCFECPHRATCYPTGRSVDAPVPAEDLLFPLAYYENIYVPVEPQPLEFNEIAALLGGAAVAEAARAAAGAPDPADDLRNGAMRTLALPGAQFFFEGDTSGLLALEVLHLKLAAFAQLVRGVRDVARDARRPHLALAPERIRGGAGWGGEGLLPVRWGLSLQVGDVLTTAPLELFEPVPGEPRVWSIPYPLPEPYVPDGMSRIQSESLFMRLTVRDLRVEATPAGSVARLQAELMSDGYRESDHGRHDLVRLAADSVPGFEGRLVVAGRKTGVIPRGFLFEGTSAPLSPEAARSVDPKRLPASWSVETTIVHTFGAPADVMSLGVLLLKLLLANDRQDGAHLNRDGAERLAAAGAGPSGRAASDRLRRFQDAFARESLDCGPAQVLFRESDRAHAEPAIPAILWEETLDLALRMASNIPGWSVCAAQDDYDDDRPARAFERILEELDNLVERARGGLIGSSGRNGLILEVCDDFLADFREMATHARPAFADEPQMTVVVSPPRAR